MGGVYARGRQLWLWFNGASGKREWEPSGYMVGQEKDAERALEKLEARIKSGLTIDPTGKVTVAGFAKHWIEERKREGKDMRSDGPRIVNHALPHIGHLLMTEVRPRHIRDLFKELKKRVGREKGDLAPRTVRHVYGVLHTMFHEAVADEFIDATPCVLKRGDLPTKMDKDPTWRATAIFTVDEVEQLISDLRLPEDRRVFYAISFLSGSRFGEIAALKWSLYDPAQKPLGKLTYAWSWDPYKKRIKLVKTEKPREVPVHPTLAAILAEWKLSGWERLFGHPPGPDDLIVPNRHGGHRDHHPALESFARDLETIGARHRRQHDTRRTMISLGLAGGANRLVLECITHKGRGDIMGEYTSFPWEELCAAILKLKISRRNLQNVISLINDDSHLQKKV